MHGCLDHMAPPWRLDMWRLRLADRAVLRLSHTWRQAGMVDTDGPVSPVLAQGYLHEALALWCAQVVTPHGRGEALWGREADAWGGPSACRRTPHGVCGCCPRGWGHATSQWRLKSPICAGAAVVPRASSGAAPGWAWRAVGGQLGTACPASGDAPHARSSTLPAHGARHGARTTGPCRGG